MKKRGGDSHRERNILRRHPSKRGQIWVEWSLNVLFNLLILAIVLWFLIENIYDVAEGTYFDRIYYSKDIGLVTSSLLASPGSVEAYYVANMSGYTINFSDQTMWIKDKSARYPNIYHFGNNSRILVYDDTIKDTLALSKEANTFRAGEDPLSGLLPSRLFCGAQGNEKLQDIKIVFDPGHTPSNPGHVNPDNPTLTEASITTAIGQNIRNSPLGSSLDKTFTRTLNTELTMEDRLKKIQGRELVVSIHVGSHPDEGIEEIVIHLPPPDDDSYRQSAALACHLANAILTEFPDLAGVAILPSRHQELRQGTTHGVMLELGNINKDQASSMLSKRGKIANAILKGMDAMFSETRRRP